MRVGLPKEPSIRIGALIVVAVGFVASAVLRAGEVVAALPESAEDGFGNPIAQSVQTAPTGSPAERTVVGPPELISEIKKIRENLDAREEALSKRELKLRILESRMKERLGEMREARERLAATAALVDDAAGKDVRRLADMYQQMKPKKAGEIFNEMAASLRRRLHRRDAAGRCCPDPCQHGPRKGLRGKSLDCRSKSEATPPGKRKARERADKRGAGVVSPKPFRDPHRV